MKISFDFDDTITEKPMQDLAKEFLKMGHEVYITTSRVTKLHGVKFMNQDLFELTDKIGIKRENITFTEYEDKFLFVRDYNMHFDDSPEEIFLINEYPGKCIGFLYERNYNNGTANF